jgi:hypothetical protein
MTSRDLGRIPEDEHARLIYLSNVFGRLFVEMARSPAHERAALLPQEVRQEVISIVDSALYAVVQILDGVIDPIRNDQLDLEFALLARLRETSSGSTVDEVELGPSGEGLCIGFHGWVERDFGSATP